MSHHERRAFQKFGEGVMNAGLVCLAIGTFLWSAAAGKVVWSLWVEFVWPATQTPTYLTFMAAFILVGLILTAAGHEASRKR